MIDYQPPLKNRYSVPVVKCFFEFFFRGLFFGLFGGLFFGLFGGLFGGLFDRALYHFAYGLDTK